jgi:arylsulfatase A-like enzyme
MRLHSYHGNPVGSAVITPTIDELSASGVRLENYYVNFLCSPTRTSLMSGRYAYTIGQQSEVIVDGVPDCMPTSVHTIADRLSEAGWATAAYGKWVRCSGFVHIFLCERDLERECSLILVLFPHFVPL